MGSHENCLAPLDRRADGITLLELTVTVGVIILLVTLLTPLLGKAWERALQAKCASNLRNLSSAATQWSQDNNGDLLPVFTDYAAPDLPAYGAPWYVLLIIGDYIPEDSIMLAPPYVTRRGTLLDCPSRDAAPVYLEAGSKFHYGMNYFPGQFGNNGAPLSGPNHKILEVPHPSKTIVFADNLSYIFDPSTSTSRIYPHRGGLNAAYYDGHVAWIKGPLPSILPYGTGPFDPYFSL